VDIRDGVKVIAGVPQNGKELLSRTRDSDSSQTAVAEKKSSHEQHD
jgi:hypothetical protein